MANIDGVIYRIYVDGTLTETTPATSFELEGLTPGATIHVKVSAVDDSGNESAQSAELVYTVPLVTAGAGRRALLGAGQ